MKKIVDELNLRFGTENMEDDNYRIFRQLLT